MKIKFLITIVSVVLILYFFELFSRDRILDAYRSFSTFSKLKKLEGDTKCFEIPQNIPDLAILHVKVNKTEDLKNQKISFSCENIKIEASPLMSFILYKRKADVFIPWFDVSCKSQICSVVEGGKPEIFLEITLPLSTYKGILYFIQDNYD